MSFGLFIVFSIVYFTISTKNLIADTWVDNVNEQELKLLKSVELSPARYQHDLVLAKIFASKTKTSMKKGELEAGLKYQKQSMDHLRLAESSGANSVVAQETAGVIYRDFSEGDDQNNRLAINAFKKAFDLEPSNPVIATNLGQALFKAKEYEQSIYYFTEALRLKSDYNLAELGLAKSLSAEGKSEESLIILKKLAKNTKDPNIYYELGLLYFNDDKFEEAQTAFSSAVTLSPLYANALYGLALTLEKTGEIEQAQYYYKKVQRLNPENQEILEKIK